MRPRTLPSPGLLLLLLLPLSAAQSRAAPPPANPESPQQLFGDLFVAVQTAAIYPDSKLFADATPDAPPGEILAQYHARHPDSPQGLARFVAAHFSLPPAAGLPAKSVPQLQSGPSGPLPIAAHIDRLWNILTRSTTTAPPYSSLLPVPRPYVVPGGRFRELYYWDSYFTLLGLAASGRADLVRDMIGDFAYLIDTYGHVPNGTRTYYLSRSQPPFFFEMVGLLAPTADAGFHVDDAGAQAAYLPQLRREYAYWMDGAAGLRPGHGRRHVVAMPDGALLNRYWDDRNTPRDEAYREDSQLAHHSRRPPRQLYRDIRAAAESGWDFSSRWLADGHTLGTIHTTQIVPIDLNALLYGLENAIRTVCLHRHEHACAIEFAHRAAARRAAIDRYLWDAAAGTYLDYCWTCKARVPRLSAAMLYPLFVALASEAQAASVAKATRGDLLKPGGIVTTMADTGQQWDAPNGWAPLQWIAVAGLRRYGHTSLAATIACRWIVNVNDVYRRSGKLVEKYDVVTIGRSGGGGEYPLQDGFGWTNGVTRKLIALYPADAAYTTSAQCP